MPVIMLSEEQAKLVNESWEPIEFQNPQGRVLAKVHPVDWTEVEHAKRVRASNSPRIPSATVQAHFRALQEAADQGMNEEQLWALYHRLKAEGKP